MYRYREYKHQLSRSYLISGVSSLDFPREDCPSSRPRAAGILSYRGNRLNGDSLLVRPWWWRHLNLGAFSNPWMICRECSIFLLWVGMMSAMMATRVWASVGHVLFVLNSQGPVQPMRWTFACPHPQSSDLTGRIQTTKATSLRLQSPLGLGRSLCGMRWEFVKKEGSKEGVMLTGRPPRRSDASFES